MPHRRRQPGLRDRCYGNKKVDFCQTHSATSLPPITIRFPTLALPGWKVTDSLTISLEREMDGSWVASDTTFLVYGDGPTAENALADYLTSLVDFFELVQAQASAGLEDYEKQVQDDPYPPFDLNRTHLRRL